MTLILNLNVVINELSLAITLASILITVSYKKHFTKETFKRTKDKATKGKKASKGSKSTKDKK